MKRELYLFLLKLSFDVQKKDSVLFSYRPFRDNLLVLLGPSSCGKSSIARRLQEYSGIVSIEYDHVFHRHLNLFFKRNMGYLYQGLKVKYRENVAHYIFNGGEAVDNQALNRLKILALRKLPAIRQDVFANILETVKKALSQGALVVVQAFGKNCLKNYQEFIPKIVLIYLPDAILQQRLEHRNKQAQENQKLLEIRDLAQVQKQASLLYQKDQYGKFTFIQPDYCINAKEGTPQELVDQIIKKIRQ